MNPALEVVAVRYESPPATGFELTPPVAPVDEAALGEESGLETQAEPVDEVAPVDELVLPDEDAAVE